MLLPPWHRGQPGARAGTAGARNAVPRPGGDDEEGTSGPLRRWSPYLLVFPAPRALTLGEVVAKFPRAAWARASEAQGGVRTPGGEDKRSSRRLCSALGERPGKESPGERWDRQPRHYGPCRGSLLPTSSFGPPLTPNPTATVLLLSPQASFPTPNFTYPPRAKVWGGGRKRVEEKVRDGPDTSQRVGVCFGMFGFCSFALEAASPRGPPFSPFPPLPGSPPLQF